MKKTSLLLILFIMIISILISGCSSVRNGDIEKGCTEICQDKGALFGERYNLEIKSYCCCTFGSEDENHLYQVTDRNCYNLDGSLIG